jgi:superfamily I DNA/RNA helicase
VELTSEQKDILTIDLSNKEHNIIVIKALAGTGKTTTLVEKVKNHPDKKFCYLSFNKAIKEEISLVIKRDNIENLNSYTMHGLAWKNVMSKFGFPNIQNLSVESIQGMFPSDSFLGKVWVIYKIILLFNKYCGQVLSFSDYKKSVLNMNPLELSYIGFTQDNINLFYTCFEYVEKIYNKFVNKTAGFITHNFYLKYFIDNLNDFNFSEFDIFLFDEAQDLNEPMAVFVKEIVKRKMPMILVGDNHQSIYSFIKSIDVMSLLEEQLPERVICKKLTNSFRFNTSTMIERLCNEILGLRGEKINGAASHNEEEATTEAYLSRANKPVFSKCLDLIDSSTKFDLIGGIESFDIKTVNDIYYLFIGMNKSIKNKYIASFSSIDQFEKEIVENNDMELSSKYLIAEICYNKRKTPDNLFKLISDNIDTSSPIKVGTIHKTKGLGFDSVVLMSGGHNTSLIGFTGEDNISHTVNNVKYKALLLQNEVNIYEELNILYVGISRAKKYLKIENQTYLNTIEFIRNLREDTLPSLEIPHLGSNKDFYSILDSFIIPKKEVTKWLAKAKSRRF